MGVIAQPEIKREQATAKLARSLQDPVIARFDLPRPKSQSNKRGKRVAKK